MKRMLALVWIGIALPQAGMANPGLYLEPSQHSAATQVALQESSPNDPVTLNANEMGADEENGIILARGDVEIMQGEAILMAEQITYYQKTNLVIAQGNVRLLQPDGNVYFAERAELKDSMKRAVIHDFKARLADNSILVANRATKVNSSVIALKQASYTPCNVCAGVAPFWQVNADKAVVNNIDERVTYNDALLEVFGFPVFYTPYLSHPTPDARGKSGLLAPSYSNSPFFGSIAKAPFYWRIDEDKDIVITPWLSSNKGGLLQFDYNQLRDAGDYHLRGSITNPNKLDDDGNSIGGHELRGHIFAQGNEEISKNNSIGFDIQRSTDDTYLRRYGFGNQQALFSNAYYEYAQGRNFGLISALSIQGLRSTDSDKSTPLILPIFQGYYETTPLDSGLRFNVAGDAQILTREEGISQRRLSIAPGVTLPMVSDGGHIFTASAKLRQDIYTTNAIDPRGDGTSTRTLPQASLEWRYPLINSQEHGSWIIEPTILNVLQPNGGNPTKISNEDSKLLELTDLNLFSIDRVAGLDLYDAGSRVAYGVRGQYYANNGTTFDGLLGQNYNFDKDTPFPNSNNAGEQFSDYIGRVAVNYAPINLSYHFAIDAKNADLNRSAITMAFYKPWLALSASYDAIKNNRYLIDSQEGQLNATLPLDERWSLYGGARRDLELNQMVSANGGLIYKNECFNLTLNGLRSYARDRDIKPTTEFTFQVGFKNLAELGGK